MDNKKGTTVLVVLALVLACTAIVINLVSSSEVPSQPKDLQVNGANGGEVGVTVVRGQVEDKLKGDNISG